MHLLQLPTTSSLILLLLLAILLTIITAAPAPAPRRRKKDWNKSNGALMNSVDTGKPIDLATNSTTDYNNDNPTAVTVALEATASPVVGSMAAAAVADVMILIPESE